MCPKPVDASTRERSGRRPGATRWRAHRSPRTAGSQRSRRRGSPARGACRQPARWAGPCPAQRETGRCRPAGRSWRPGCPCLQPRRRRNREGTNVGETRQRRRSPNAKHRAGDAVHAARLRLAPPACLPGADLACPWGPCPQGPCRQSAGAGPPAAAPGAARQSHQSPGPGPAKQSAGENGSAAWHAKAQTCSPPLINNRMQKRGACHGWPPASRPQALAETCGAVSPAAAPRPRRPATHPLIEQPRCVALLGVGKLDHQRVLRPRHGCLVVQRLDGGLARCPGAELHKRAACGGESGGRDGSGGRGVGPSSGSGRAGEGRRGHGQCQCVRHSRCRAGVLTAGSTHQRARPCSSGC